MFVSHYLCPYLSVWALLFPKSWGNYLIFIGFASTERGITCAFKNLKDLSQDECQVEATNFAKKNLNSNAQFGGSVGNVGDGETYPKGCFIHKNGIIKFNIHEKGGKHQGVKSICKSMKNHVPEGKFSSDRFIYTAFRDNCIWICILFFTYSIWFSVYH